MFALVPATEAHALDLAANLSSGSMLECQQMGWNPGPHCVYVLRTSAYVFAAVEDGRCFCMFGCYPDSLVADSGQVWLLTAATLPKERIRMAMATRHYLPYIRNRFTKIYGWVYEGNAVSIKWLKWLGYEISPETTPLGPDSALYHYCEWKPCQS